MRSSLFTASILMLVSAPLTAVGQTSQPAGIGKDAPAFELRGSDGKTYKLADLQDKVVVLEWWNRDCPVSRKYMPKMKELSGKYAKKGVVWLAIDSTYKQTNERRDKFIKKHKITYSVLIDRNGKVGHAYGARTTPHMFVIDHGKLVYRGAIDDRHGRNYVAQTLDAILAGKDVPLAKTKPFGCSVKYKK